MSQINLIQTLIKKLRISIDCTQNKMDEIHNIINDNVDSDNDTTDSDNDITDSDNDCKDNDSKDDDDNKGSCMMMTYIPNFKDVMNKKFNIIDNKFEDINKDLNKISEYVDELK
jgi:hypothetical protein